VARGLLGREIAGCLQISIKTVETHEANAVGPKLDVTADFFSIAAAKIERVRQ
jgi:DNA-binding NarL/FixJ family response regulator